MAGSGSGSQVQETGAQKQQAVNDANLWNYSQTTYKPFIDKYIAKQATDQATPAQSNNVKGQVNAEVMKGISESAKNPRVINPVAAQKITDSGEQINATAQNTAANAVRQRQLGSQQNIVDIGRGQQTENQQNQADIASQSLKTAIRDTDIRNQQAGAIENAAGSLVGAGVAEYKRGRVDEITDPFGTDFGRKNVSNEVPNG